MDAHFHLPPDSTGGSRGVFEVAVDSLGSALAARDAGADRLELCADLPSGGLTPSAGLTQQVCELTGLPVAVLIRPRRGDFLYSNADMAVMRRDIDFANAIGAESVVIGCLTPDGDIDRHKTAQLVAAAHPLPVVFHRAFDLCREPLDALETLCELGIARLLTSGQAASADEGAPLIGRLVAQAGERLIVMPGGGINAGNIRRIAETTGASEFHFSARVLRDSGMAYRKAGMSLGDGDDYARWDASRTRIREIMAAL